MSKRKNPASPHTHHGSGAPSTPGGSSSSGGGGGGSVNALLASDPRLLARISAFLGSLPAHAPPVTPSAIVEHLRSSYAEYARKPKEFGRMVERLCERMRAEAAASVAGQEQPAAAAAAADVPMSDVQQQRGAAPGDDVVILSSSHSATPAAAAASPNTSSAAAHFASSIGFAAVPASASAGPSTLLDRAASAPVSAASADGGGAQKKRRKDDPAASPIAGGGGGGSISAASSGAEEGEDGDSSDEEEENSVVELAADLSVSGGAGTSTPSGGAGREANSAMRNLYMKAQQQQQQQAGSGSGAAAAAATPAAASEPAAATGSSSKPRERKNKGEKIVYTQNSTKKSTKKRAAALRAGGGGGSHFTSLDGSADDVAAAGAGGGGGGGGGRGDGSGWTPEVLYPTSSYEDLGGIEPILQDIRELIEYPLSHPEIYAHLGVQAPRGVLLHGPPGCGKTLLAHCIAGELGLPLLKISAPEVVSGMSGESEAKLRTLFSTALDNAPCLVFIDEIDAITPKRATAQREMERRIVAQLLTCMDSLSTSNTMGNGKGEQNKIVIVIGATNRPDSLDAALRRAGRFDREIALPIPDEAARGRILSVMCRSMKVAGGHAGFDWASIAKRAVGYVGADLMALTREAAVLAINRIFRAVLPTPHLRPVDVANHLLGTGAGAGAGEGLPPALSLGSGSPKLGPAGAVNPPSAAAVPNRAAQQLAASLTAAAAAAGVGSTALVPSSSSPRLSPSSSTAATAHLIPDLKSVVAASELSSRSHASAKLRAQTSPLTEEQLAPLAISFGDFELALKKVQPSSKREGFATIPDVTWNDIGALEALREELEMTILQPILNPLQFESIGLTVPAGVLLFGPPGCGKTLVAKAIANESGASFLSIKGPELLNQYVGQSERAVRKVFQRARASAPCVIFFDELDALVPKRGGGGSSGSDGGSQVSERVVNQLLTEMDGLEERRFVFVIAATNRPDMIDPAMLRPGRLDKLLYVRLPSAGERESILRKHLRRTPLDPAVDIGLVARDPRGEGFSGADIAALCREATLAALREAQTKAREEAHARGEEGLSRNLVPGWASTMGSKGSSAAAASPATASSSSAAPAAPAASTTPSAQSFNHPPLPVLVRQCHFSFAFTKVFPSVSHASRIKYDRMHALLCRARSTLSNEVPGGNIGGGESKLLSSSSSSSGAAGGQGSTAAAAATLEEQEAEEADGATTNALEAASGSPKLGPIAALPPRVPRAPLQAQQQGARGMMPPPPAAHAGTILSSMNAQASGAAAPAAPAAPAPAAASAMDLH